MKDQTRRPSAYWRPQPDKPLCSEVGCTQPATVWTRRRSFCSHCAPPSALLPAYDQIRAELATMAADRDAIRRHLEILALETTRRLNEMADIQERYEIERDEALSQTARLTEALRGAAATAPTCIAVVVDCQQRGIEPNADWCPEAVALYRALANQPGDRREGDAG